MTTSLGADDSLTIPQAVLGGRARRWRRRGLALALALAATLVVLFFALRERTPEPRYRLAPVARRSVASVVEATGFVDVEQRTDVPAPQTGQLQKILAREGARVKAGDLLAELDASAAKISVQSSRAALSAASGAVAEARAALEAANDTLQRLERLQARGLAADAEIAAARANAEKARAALSGARAKSGVASGELDAAELARGTLSLRAPVDGVVLQAPDVVGAVVSPEQGPLFVVGSPLDTMRIDARVGEADVGQVRPGQRVTFTVPA